MAKLTKEKVTNCLKGSALTLATLAGVIGGVIFGLALRTREGKKFHSEGKDSTVWKLRKLTKSVIVPFLLSKVPSHSVEISGC